MKYAWFPGCKIAHHQPQYGADVQELCIHLDVLLKHVEFACCGWPLRQESLTASAVSAARNLALAEKEGLPILTPCKCCYGNLKVMWHKLRDNPELQAAVKPHLENEGLSMPENPQIVHLLTVMDQNLDTLRKLAGDGLNGLPVAASYGCHALRPSEATDFDDPLAPTVFERVLKAIGTRPVDWPMRLECCGHFLRDKNDAMSSALAIAKRKSAKASGASEIVTACTYCQMQFETFEPDPQYTETETVAALALRAIKRAH